MLKYSLIVLAITAALVIFQRIVPITASDTIELVTLPIPDALLTAACTGLTYVTDPYPMDQRQCGFWLIDPRTQRITKLAQLEAGDEHGETLIWLAGGKGFLFNRAAVANITFFFYPFAYFDEHEFSVDSNDIGGGVVVSPDDNYFMAMDCRTANLNPGSRFVLYSAQTGQKVCALLTGEASMTGCQDDNFSQSTCTAPLSDGSTWVLSPVGNTSIGAQICQPDGTCAPQDLFNALPKFYTSVRFVSFAFANRVVLYDTQDRQLQIYTLPADYSVVTSSWSPP